MLNREQTRNIRGQVDGPRSPRSWKLGWLRWSHLLRDGALSLILKGSYTALSFATTVLLARLLSPEGYGVYTYALAWVTIIGAPAHAGLATLALRESASGLARAEPWLVRGAWRWTVLGTLSISVGVALVFGFLLPVSSTWSGAHGTRTLMWAVGLVPLVALGNSAGGALRGLQHVVMGQLPELVVRPGLFLCLLMLAALTGPDSLSPERAMALHVVAALGAAIFGVVTLWMHTPQAMRKVRARLKVREWLRSSAAFGVASGLTFLNNQAGVVVLGLLKNPSEVGIYRIAAQMASLSVFGLQAATMAVGPRMAEAYALRDTERLQKLATHSSRVALAYSAVIAVGFLLFGRWILGAVLGPEFGAAYLPLLVLLLGQMANSATGSVTTLLNMTGRERETMLGLAAGVMVNVGLSFGFVPLWETLGAAVATSISMIVWNLVLWWRARSGIGVDTLAVCALARRGRE